MRLVLIAAFIATLGGCASCQSTAPSGPTEAPSTDFSVCVLNHYQDDVSQIASECGAANTSDVTRILDAANAMRWRAALDAGLTP